MRKFLLVAAAAACLLAVSQQKASAWSSFKCIVGVGVSWERSSPCDAMLGGCHGPASFPAYGGSPAGFAMGGYDGMAHPAAASAPAAAPATAPAATSAVKPASYQEYYYGGYQQTGCNYSAPYYFYGYGQAPSYWYGY